MKYYWFRTLDKKWYICEIKGVCFVTWINAGSKGSAMLFPENTLNEWKLIIEDMTGEVVEAVEPFV